MDSQHAYEMTERSGLMAGMRGNFPPETALRVADIMMKARINVFELTMNSVQPLEAMQALKREYGDQAVVGMGTVLNPDMARQALDAGADCIIAPSFDPVVVELVQKADVLAIPGVMTPTEIINAWHMGTKLLKIFPIGVLGLDYFKAVRAPLDQVKFCCNGGMTDQNVGDFIRAGATCCGMAGWLTGDGSMSLETIAHRANTLRDIVDRTRANTPVLA
ncbi:MAG: bifunctional 4-hydroxy-2-oxoglutarate aldolase/2-dehydro-3-deoxy-phosphogluconate aldolase [bacterium]|nr:bifunctional 4-hydroxy-2-oxoglutarate aldolase/2-dehydro-3-deoxy-phosphogluconate aldolase [bacterium]